MLLRVDLLKAVNHIILKTLLSQILPTLLSQILPTLRKILQMFLVRQTILACTVETSLIVLRIVLSILSCHCLKGISSFSKIDSALHAWLQLHQHTMEKHVPKDENAKNALSYIPHAFNISLSQVSVNQMGT